MTNGEFQAYLASLPPEVRDVVIERTKLAKAYFAKAVRTRSRIYAEFPNMNPRVVAALSLVIARFT